MSRAMRAVLAGGAAVVLVVASAGSGPSAKAGGTAEVVFRVTLEGPVLSSDAFAVLRGCREERCTIEDAEVVCSPPDIPMGDVRCSARTYEFSITVAVGLTVEYALMRWATADPSDTLDTAEELLPGSWVVRAGRQVISLGYDYGASGAPQEPTLPDTGMETGEVTFRLTLEGPIPEGDGFLLDVECGGDDPLCDPIGNFMCAFPEYNDVRGCDERILEAEGLLAPQTIEWRLYRVQGLPTNEHARDVVLSGSWTVHAGRQVISLGYVYPGEAPAPVLPDTAMSRP